MCMGSFDDGPVVIAGVAGLFAYRHPIVRIRVELGRENPLLERRFLLRGAIGIDLDETASRRQALNFAQCSHAFPPLEIVHGIDRYHGFEAVVRKRQLDGVAKMEPPNDFRLAMHERIFRDIEPEGFEAGAYLDEVLYQKTFAATDIEHAVARLEMEVRDHVLGYGNPAAVVAITPIAVLARPIEVELAVLA